MLRCIRLVLGIAAFSSSTLVGAAPFVFSVGGDATSASIQPTVDAFRATLGVNNGSAAGPLASGRREINWDAGGSVTTTSTGTPFDGFLDTRGARFSTPGTGFLQATPDSLGLAFGNATYGNVFGTFSAQRLFVPTGSNVTDVLFFVPGSGGLEAATVSAFGAVFTDVDLANTTSIALFDEQGDLLHTAFAAAGTTADKSLSFLGVLFGAGERIARVRITTGNAALGAGTNDGGGTDLVVMDDFIYGEPLAAAAVPEPSSLALLGLGGLLLLRARRRSGQGL